MKDDIIRTCALMAVLLGIIALTSFAKADAINSGNIQQNQTLQNSGNTQKWETTGSNNGNETYYNQKTDVKDAYNNINNSKQEINNSHTSINQEGVIGNGNKIGSNSGGGDITSKSYSEGGSSESESSSKSNANGGSSSANAGSATASTGQITVNNGVGGQQPQANLRIRHDGLVQAPNLAPLIGYVSQNEGSCMYSNGGSASGSNGMASGGLSVLFGLSDDNCETLQRVKFLMSAGAPDTACELLLIYDKEERDGYFARAVNSTGGCVRFKPVAAPLAFAPSPTAINTQQRLNSLKSPNALIDQQFNNGMIK
jgi:hypothetical protein